MSLVTKFISTLQTKAWDSEGFCQKMIEFKKKKQAITEAELVDMIVQIALNQDLRALKTLSQNYDVDLNTLRKDSFTVMHLLVQLNHPQVLEAILFLLQQGASFSIVDNAGKTPFHLLHQFATPEIISSFWKNELIWNCIREKQEYFDIPDKEGKKAAHYLVAGAKLKSKVK